MESREVITTSTFTRLNVFPIKMEQETVFSYALWRVEPTPSTSELREKIRTFLWRKALRRPVFSTYSGDEFAFGVMSSDVLKEVEYIGDGEIVYRIYPTGEHHTINVDAMNEHEAGLVAAILQQELNAYLRNSRQLTHSHRGNIFFLTEPDRPYTPIIHRRGQQKRYQPAIPIDIFRGFNFRIAHFAGHGPCLILDITTRYIGKLSLADYLKTSGIPRDLEAERGITRWIYDYETTKQSVYLVRVLEQRIGELMIKDKNSANDEAKISVYDYLRARQPHIAKKISTEDQAALAVYRLDDLYTEAKHFTIAATLLKPQYKPGNPDVRALGDAAAFPPQERMRRILDYSQRFQNIPLGNKAFILEPALDVPSSTLPFPELLFGPSSDPTKITPPNVKVLERRLNWGTQKSEALRAYGPYKKTSFTKPYFVYPHTLENNGVVERFLEHTRVVCQKYGGIDFDPELAPYRSDAHAIDIIKKLQGLAQAQKPGFILLGLPSNSRHATQVYTALKTQIKVASKCFSASNLLSKSRDLRKFDSYVERNTLSMLVENGTRPWGFASPLNYELQFGFDVARTQTAGIMGASVIDEPSGTNIIFDYRQMDKAERIKVGIIGKFILEYLDRFFATHKRVPQSILFQRDGRLLESELRGIRTAIDRFWESHPGQPRAQWAAISIEKTTSIPLRLFHVGEKGIPERVPSGSYFLQDEKTGYLVTAGAPSLSLGTPRPIRVEIVGSDSVLPPIEPIIRDIFWLSQLNWTTPEVDIGLPITLRFTDQKLEQYALEAPVVEDEDEWGN